MTSVGSASADRRTVRSPASLLTRLRRPHRLSVRFGITTVDQCISSLSNFAVGIGVARIAGIEAFGGYSLVYSSWLILAALHRATVTDPMAISNDLLSPDAREHVRAGLAAELTLGAGAAVLFGAIGGVLLGLGQEDFGVSFVGLAAWLPFLLAQDYWRWTSFMKAEPQHALANDLVFDAVQLAAFVGLYFIGIRSALLAVTAWGIGAFVGAVFGLRQFGVRPKFRGGAARLRLRWWLSKWLVANDVTSQATTQFTSVLTGGFLGPVGIGGLRSATSLVSGPSLVLLQASGNVGLPEAARALSERGWPGLRRVERLITVAGMASVGTVAAVVLVFGRRLLELLYGAAFGRFAVAADILALGFFLGTVGLGAILCLKVTRQTRRFLPVSIASAVVSIGAVIVLAPLYGVNGAAAGMSAGILATTVGLLVMHWRHSRAEAERMGSGEEAVVLALAPGPARPQPDQAEAGPAAPAPAPALQTSGAASEPGRAPVPECAGRQPAGGGSLYQAAGPAARMARRVRIARGGSMAIVVDPRSDATTLRDRIYGGDLIVFTRLGAVADLVDHVRAELAALFAPRDPEAAHGELDRVEMAAILADWKPAFIHSTTSAKLVCDVIQEAGFSPDETYFDLPRPRTAFPVGHLTSGIAYAFPWHRDTWYAAPRQQINWWLPVYSLEPDNAMGFDLAQFAREVPNTSGEFDYYQNNRDRVETTQRPSEERQSRPGAFEHDALDEVVVLPPPGAVLLFSGAHLHRSIPNTSARARYSVDFRTVERSDVEAGVGAPAVDVRCSGTSLRDFRRISDGTPVDEATIRRLHGAPPDGAMLVYGQPTGR